MDLECFVVHGKGKKAIHRGVGVLFSLGAKHWLYAKDFLAAMYPS